MPIRKQKLQLPQTQLNQIMLCQNCDEKEKVIKRLQTQIETLNKQIIKKEKKVYTDEELIIKQHKKEEKEKEKEEVKEQAKKEKELVETIKEENFKLKKVLLEKFDVQL